MCLALETFISKHKCFVSTTTNRWQKVSKVCLCLSPVYNRFYTWKKKEREEIEKTKTLAIISKN